MATSTLQEIVDTLLVLLCTYLIVATVCVVLHTIVSVIIDCISACMRPKANSSRMPDCVIYVNEGTQIRTFVDGRFSVASVRGAN